MSIGLKNSLYFFVALWSGFKWETREFMLLENVWNTERCQILKRVKRKGEVYESIYSDYTRV